MIYITHSSKEQAVQISDTIVSEKLAACANVFPITSIYWWNDIVNQDDEWVSILKTVPEMWEILQKRISQLHDYEVPCIIKLDVGANESYEKWIRDSVKIPDQE